MKRKPSDLAGLRNLGPTIIRQLAEVEIHSEEDLHSIGPAEAYRRICARSGGRTVPVCYYLYSLEGALRDVHWDDLPADTKARLRTQVTALE